MQSSKNLLYARSFWGVSNEAKRYVYIKNFRRPTEPHEVAIAHSDKVLSEYFKEMWPKVRCALLSRRKFAALINRRSSNSIDYTDDFIEQGAEDIMAHVKQKAKSEVLKIETEIRSLEKELTVTEEKEMYKIDDADVPISQSDAVKNNIKICQTEKDVYNQLVHSCPGLKLYSYPKNVIEEFPDCDNEYFKIDGANIVPLLALDPQMNDSILDLCAAPGIKLACLLQTSFRSLVANDLNSIRTVKKTVSKCKYDLENITYLTADATSGHDMGLKIQFDKVLVDVPNTNERKSMIENEKPSANIYSKLNKHVRAQIPHVQAQILRTAILLCKPGGYIVYSTSTPFMNQNEYVVQYTLQAMAEEDINCEVVDMSAITNVVKDFMHIQGNDLNTGVLVVPLLSSNFGPLYTCKIRRIS